MELLVNLRPPLPGLPDWVGMPFEDSVCLVSFGPPLAAVIAKIGSSRFS